MTRIYSAASACVCLPPHLMFCSISMSQRWSKCRHFFNNMKIMYIQTILLLFICQWHIFIQKFLFQFSLLSFFPYFLSFFIWWKCFEEKLNRNYMYSVLFISPSNELVIWCTSKHHFSPASRRTDATAYALHPPPVSDIYIHIQLQPVYSHSSVHRLRNINADINICIILIIINIIFYPHQTHL